MPDHSAIEFLLPELPFMRKAYTWDPQGSTLPEAATQADGPGWASATARSGAASSPRDIAAFPTAVTGVNKAAYSLHWPWSSHCATDGLEHCFTTIPSPTDW